MLNQAFNELHLEQYPDKTLIGRTDRGFDFLGYRFEPDSLSVADQTIERFKERITRLYEQGADVARIGEYVCMWMQWAHAGLGDWQRIMDKIIRLRALVQPEYIFAHYDDDLPWLLPPALHH